MGEHGRDRETESEVVAVFGAVEGAEDFGEFFLGDLRAGIADEDVDSALGFWSDDAGAADFEHGAAAGLLTCFSSVAKEFYEDFFESSGVNVDKREAKLDVHFE